MNFKLEKSSTSSSNYRYTFKVDDSFVDLEFFSNDADATEWYNKYKSVYQPESKHTIITYLDLKLERRVKVEVTNHLQVHNKYSYCIWKENSLLNLYFTYNEQESDELYEQALSQFLKYKGEYSNIKPENSYVHNVLLFDETN
jgi:hypothetical protein